MTATRARLEELHRRLTEIYIEELDGEFKSPSLYSSINKFLSDNEVIASKEEDETKYKILREKLEEKKKAARVINLSIVQSTDEEKQQALKQSRAGS